MIDWSRPEPDEYGVCLNAPQATSARRERYRQSFHALRAALATQLRGALTVFTHNPWGEYGHPDHVQLARVVESLRPELGFRQLYSGYIAHRTMPLAAPLLPRLGRWFELPTRPDLVEPIAALYREHGCWTWPTDYRRFSSESFLEASDELPAAGSGFRLNCVTA
jgi:LmbE family N-acetylglucosaminyl deacetylase